ncbi:MAG: HNH endonuclease [Chloroflexi bacterium]|mgnify:CR=1 FL=1|nr:HNH endonuclease [Chloroflexota bacterium]
MSESTRAPVLVLNQNYQPLNICDIRRAVKLVGKGKAESVQDTGEYVHTFNDIFDRPDVIRLISMVNRPLQRRKMSRNEIFSRDKFSCQYCGSKASDLTIDHVTPRCKGGEFTWTNVVSACKTCNHRKAAQTPQEAGMRLRNNPYEPRPNPYSFLKFEFFKKTWLPFVPWMVPESNPSSGQFAMAVAVAGD